MVNMCTFEGDREAVLIAYVYGELESPAKESFEAHFADCGLCRLEISELQGARIHLQAWQPPDSGVWSAIPNEPERGRWTGLPAWAQLAAAVMLFGVGIGAANLRVSYAPGGGVLVTTGWMARDRAAAVQASRVP